jgi:hypothetical protein
MGPVGPEERHRLARAPAARVRDATDPLGNKPPKKQKTSQKSKINPKKTTPTRPKYPNQKKTHTNQNNNKIAHNTPLH